jgi:hypothetical protein
LFAAVAVLLGGCADSTQVTVLPTVGPTATLSRRHYTPMGHLVVYTAVHIPPIASDTLYYPHTSYALYERHGKLLRWVRNNIGPWDEQPEVVSLAPGRYTVEAKSELQGDVMVPVIIASKKTTVVNLQRVKQRPGLAWLGN